MIESCRQTNGGVALATRPQCFQEAIPYMIEDLTSLQHIQQLRLTINFKHCLNASSKSTSGRLESKAFTFDDRAASQDLRVLQNASAELTPQMAKRPQHAEAHWSDIGKSWWWMWWRAGEVTDQWVHGAFTYAPSLIWL